MRLSSPPRAGTANPDRPPLVRAWRAGGLGFSLAVPAVAAFGFLAAGAPGLWGALLGLLLPVAFLSITVGVAVATSSLQATTMGAIVLGSWMVKLVLFGGVMVAVRAATFYSRAAFVASFAVGLVGYLTVETAAILRARQPYIDPSSPPV